MSALRPWIVVTALCLVFCLWVIAANNGDPLALATIGTRYSQGDPDGTEGYDGQFVYAIARDFDGAAPYLDVPAYRYQRILLPFLGGGLSFGQTALIPWVLLAINLVALAAGTAILETLLAAQNVSRWYALGYGLSLGAFGAVRLSLPEPLAYGLALGGIALALRDRPLWSAILFALAALAKETTLILAAAIGLYLVFNRRWFAAVAFGVIALTPFIAWQIFLHRTFGAFGVGSGGALATSFEVIPFAGVARILIEGSLNTFVVLGAILFPFVILPTVWGLVRCWRDFRKGEVSVYTWLVLITALVMPFVPFSTYRELVAVLRFIVGLQIAVILYAAHAKAKRPLRYSTFWALTSLFVIIGFQEL